MSEPVAYASLPPTPQMMGAGLSFGSLVEYARKAVNLLETTGDTFVDLLEDGFRLWQAVSNRDLSGVLAAFASGRDNVEKIVKAIKDEFGIE